MTQTDQPAVNARVVPVVEYGIDQRGWGLFSRLSGRHQRGVSGRDTPPVVERVGYWHGALHSLQHFRGAANLGTAELFADANPELSDGRQDGVSDPGAMAIFAERSARRQR